MGFYERLLAGILWAMARSWHEHDGFARLRMQPLLFAGACYGSGLEIRLADVRGLVNACAALPRLARMMWALWGHYVQQRGFAALSSCGWSCSYF